MFRVFFFTYMKTVCRNVKPSIKSLSHCFHKLCAVLKYPRYEAAFCVLQKIFAQIFKNPLTNQIYSDIILYVD